MAHLKILVVPDPGRKKTQLQLQQKTYTDWVLTSLPNQEAEYLLKHVDLDGLIFAATPQQSHGKEVPAGHQMVYINEVVSKQQWYSWCVSWSWLQLSCVAIDVAHNWYVA